MKRQKKKRVHEFAILPHGMQAQPKPDELPTDTTDLFIDQKFPTGPGRGRATLFGCPVLTTP